MRPSRIAMLLFTAFACSVVSGYALNLDLSVAGAASTETEHAYYPEVDAKLVHEGSSLGFTWDISMDGSNQYGSIFGGDFGFATVRIKQGGLKWRGNGAWSASLGVLPLQDDVDSPYSLALSSKGNSALNAAFRYEDERFFFSDIWFALNYDSGGTFIKGNGKDNNNIPLTAPETINWPDRSAVIKSYGIKLGEFRLGFQDLIVFTNLDYGTSAQRGPLMDLEYFINPAPAYLIQYAYTKVDAPWEKNGSINDNSLMGFFATWKRGRLAASAQFLIDDFNLNRIMHPSSYQNPDKVAWALGGSLDTEYGTIRLDQAGATRYCFEASGFGGEDNLAYGYTYYPDTEFALGDTIRTINPEDNYVGYLHGENNLAFMASWTKDSGSLSARAELEFTISGSKSPANPWGTNASFPNGARLLDERVLEKKLVLAASANYGWRNLRFFALGEIGYVWNRLALTAVEGEVRGSINNGIPYYKPSGDSAFIGAITLGGTWSLQF